MVHVFAPWPSHNTSTPPPTPVTKMFYKDPRKGPLKYYDDTNDAELWRRHVEILLYIYLLWSWSRTTDPWNVSKFNDMFMICNVMVFKHFDPNYKTMHRSKVSYMGGGGGGQGSGPKMYIINRKVCLGHPLLYHLIPSPRENYVELKEEVNITIKDIFYQYSFTI